MCHTELLSSQLYLCFFFLMIRRPPRSTLFPYNDALPISPSAAVTHALHPTHHASHAAAAHHPTLQREHMAFRSEEHTSELQSHLNIVCRLLLEKKKSTHQAELRNMML